MVKKCDFCDKDGYISYQSTVGLKRVKDVCKFHYKIKLIEEVHMSENVKPECRLCRAGVLDFAGLKVLGDRVLVSFICIDCKAYSQENRKIDSYFKI